MARFTLPRDLYHGAGSLEELKNLKGKKAVVVVGGGSMKRFGFLQRVEEYLKEAGMEVALFEGVEPDPSVETVMKGAKLMQEFNALHIPDMPPVTELFPLNGSYVNLSYPLPNGQTVKLLKDENVYLGTQLPKANSDRCYGLIADAAYLLISEYGENGADPIIVLFKKR